MDEPQSISAIIPLHNGADYIAGALESIYAQTRQPQEIIVVDDGSTDGGADELAEWLRHSHRLTLISQANAGDAAARNMGIAHSTGQFLAFLDQDDRWTPEKLAVQVGAMEAEPNLLATYTRLICSLEPGMECPGWVRSDSLDRPVAGYTPSTLVVRREILAHTGLFNADQSLITDVGFHLLIRDLGLPMRLLEEVLLHRTIHHRNGSSNVEKTSKSLLWAVKQSMRRRRASSHEQQAGGQE